MIPGTHPTLEPIKPRPSLYNIDPAALKSRAAHLPGMMGFLAADLFPDLPAPLPAGPPETVKAQIRELTIEQLNQMDLSKIQSGDSVNILTSHHGFTLHGGEAFAEMIKTVRDEVERRCSTKNIRQVNSPRFLSSRNISISSSAVSPSEILVSPTEL